MSSRPQSTAVIRLQTECESAVTRIENSLDVNSRRPRKTSTKEAAERRRGLSSYATRHLSTVFALQSLFINTAQDRRVYHIIAGGPLSDNSHGPAPGITPWRAKESSSDELVICRLSMHDSEVCVYCFDVRRLIDPANTKAPDPNNGIAPGSGAARMNRPR